jgi:selenocysteine-specific translation elongation factor
MIIGTAGHINHGKTSLVRALSGVDTDRLKEGARHIDRTRLRLHADPVWRDARLH